MANTQGMSDEDLESLLLSNDGGAVPSPGAEGRAGSGNNKKKEPPPPATARRRPTGRIRSAAARDAIRRRMEMPMAGDRPAATVVRVKGGGGGDGPPKLQTAKTPATAKAATSSKGVTFASSGTNRQQQKTTTTTEGAKRGGGPSPSASASPPPVDASDQPSSSSPPVMGEVKERTASRRRRRGRKAAPVAVCSPATKQTRFPTSTGFPSVKDQPMGTLVNPKTMRDGNGSTKSDGDTMAGGGGGQQHHQSGSSGGDLSDLRQAAGGDADALLAQMSPSEIQENVRELQASLSHETLEFLKKRRQQQQRAGTERGRQSRAKPPGSSRNATAEAEVEPGAPASAEERGRIDAHDDAAADLPRQGVEEEGTREKERLAQIMSSIKTYEDMDAAYAAEVAEGISAMKDRESSASKGRGENDDNEFALACELVRSSVRRQNLWAARKVAQKLEGDCERKRNNTLNESGPPPSYPVLLPVSLRCLLDAPPSSNGYVLHTYVLQALHSLLLLRACDSHFVDVGATLTRNKQSATASLTQLFQVYFLDDAVPTPRRGTCACYDSSSADGTKPVTPITSDKKDGNSDSKSKAPDAAAYATSSSSTSAQSDGEAFRKDPTWTLLSKMRIIPRLALLLRPSKSAAPPQSPSSSLKLPTEALVAICGILLMVGQRSPGAASAIAHHPTVLSDLLHQTLLCGDNGGDAPGSNSVHCDPGLGLPAITLLCTLARQSRAVAEVLSDIELILLRVLAVTKPRSDQEYELQRWAVVLWRTLLRYGLGLSHLSTMLSIAAPYLTLGPGKEKYSLASDFFSAFACVLNCIRVSRRVKPHDGRIAKEATEILISAGTWLSSSARNAMKHISIAASDSAFPTGGLDEDCLRIEAMRFIASCMRFLDSYFILQSDDDASESNGEFKTQALSSSDENSCVEALHSIVEPEIFVEMVGSVMAQIFEQESGLADDDYVGQCTTCAYLSSLLSLTISIWKNSQEGFVDRKVVDLGKLETLVEALGQRIVTAFAANSGPLARTKIATTQRRRLWLDKVAVSVAKFLASTRTLGLDATRAMVFSAIGRLALGDEGLAAILLSYDGLFQPRSAVNTVSAPVTSPLSTMLVRELCRTDLSKKQLDHSFKLHGGLGITSSGVGPFELQSLLCETENQGTRSDRDAFLLPMGALWLWQTLSGSVVRDQVQDGIETGIGSEAIVVVSTCLGLISDVENSEDSLLREYTSRIAVGSRLYHLSNVCLQPEVVLKEQRIQLNLNLLFQKYSESDEDWTDDFMHASYLHSTTSSTSGSAQLVESLLSPDPKNKSEKLYKDSLRALEDFVGDLCNTYVEYGAEYPAFTRCLRLFLLPGFPSKIRCDVLSRARGLLHLFTLDNEETYSALPSLLSQYVVGGMPSVDNSAKDSSDVLDAFCAVFARGSGARLDSGLISCMASALLARSLAIGAEMKHQPKSATDSSTMTSISRVMRRMEGLDRSFALRVLQVASRFLSSPGTKSDLVRAAIEVNAPANNSEGKPFPEELLPSNLEECDWEPVFEYLSSQNSS